MRDSSAGPQNDNQNKNFFEKVIEWIFAPGGKQEDGGNPTSSPQPNSPPISPPNPDSDTELSAPAKAREVVKYILDLEDSIVSSIKITDETITPDDLASVLRFKDGDYLDLSTIIPTGNDMGLKLPQSNDCSKITDEGLTCWDRDDNVFTIGIGDGRSQFYGFGPSIDSSEITNGTVSFDDLANDATLDATTTWALGTSNFILNLSSTGDFIVQDNGTAFATFADDGSFTLANDLTISGNDLIFGNSERIVNTTDGTIGFTDSSNTLLSIVDQGAYGTLRLVDKGSTGDPASCTAGDIYFNATDATFKGCSASNTWEALDGGGGLGYTLSVGTTNGNPADSTTYYLATGVSITTATDAGRSYTRFYIPKAGTVKAVYGSASVISTLGSSETSTLAVRLNDTSSTTITSSLAFDATPTTFSNSNLSIAVVAGDYLSITLATPAWVTNPINALISLTIYIE